MHRGVVGAYAFFASRSAHTRARSSGVFGSGDGVKFFGGVDGVRRWPSCAGISMRNVNGVGDMLLALWVRACAARREKASRPIRPDDL